MNHDLRVTAIYGVIEEGPLVFSVVPYERGPWWWRTREWKIECEGNTLGSFKYKHDADHYLRIAVYECFPGAKVSHSSVPA